jgi:hypothetical protein
MKKVVIMLIAFVNFGLSGVAAWQAMRNSVLGNWGAVLALLACMAASGYVLYQAYKLLLKLSE